MWYAFDQILEMKSTSSSVAFFRVVGLIYNLCFYFFPSLRYISIERWRQEELKKDNDSRRPLQRHLAHLPGGGVANKEGGVKATIDGGGEGEWVQKWGCNNDNNKYGANKVALAAQTIQQSTIQR